MTFDGLNFLAILIATVAAFGLGAVWYSPMLFGSTWQRLVGLSDEDIKNSNMAKIFGLAFILTFIAALLMATMMEVIMMLGASVVLGMVYGALVAMAFVMTSLGINYLFARRSAKLYFIDAGYLFFMFVIMGAIIGAMP